MLTIKYHKKFKRDYKAIKSRGYKVEELEAVIDLLANEKVLPERMRDHQLENSRNYQNVRECHVRNDWLLVYQIDQGIKLLRLVRTGTHNDLF